ncbi:hypothetical protein B484DRAFT_456312 [Ochromonadaceae sp. CCMP2298]|nr:hypothetical protein B484DRAFT_456312 [Ochromonadaceae sp. CCMP2298]
MDKDQDEYREKLELLETIIRTGVMKLLTETKENGYLDRPYGRLPFPTPLITENEFNDMGGLNCDDAEPDFNFQYGFDPLKYFADFIIWSHPDTVEQRRVNIVNSALYLKKRAQHAQRQLSTVLSLVELATEQGGSGILWGPISSPTSPTSLLLSAMPLKKGKVIFQVSTKKNFQEILHTVEVRVLQLNVEEEPQLADILPVKAELTSLVPATQYYVRCCLSSNPEVALTVRQSVDSVKEVELEDVSGFAFKGPQGGVFKQAQVWAVPADDRSAPVLEDEELKEVLIQTSRTRRSSTTRKSESNTTRKSESKAGSTTDVPAEDLSAAFSAVELMVFGQLPLGAYTDVCDAFTSTPTPAPSTNPVMPKLLGPKFPTLTCLLGDVIPHAQMAVGAHQHDKPQLDDTQETFNRFQEDISKLFQRCPLFHSPQSPLRTSGFLLGWRDGAKGSHYSLRAEELSYRQYRQELKKYNKKVSKSKIGGTGPMSLHLPGPSDIKLKRLPFTDSIRSLLNQLPIPHEILEDLPMPKVPTTGFKSAAAQAAAQAAALQTAMESVRSSRMMHRSMMLGPDVLVIVLDMRGRGVGGEYLGMHQAGWLSETLRENTNVQWKIILSGKSLGVISVMEEEELPTGITEAGETGVVAREVVEGQAQEPQEPRRSVQLPHDQDKAHVAITAAMKDGVEDVYGRSIHSLAHILSEYQTFLGREDRSMTYKATEFDSRVVHVSSGLLVLSSGLAPICPDIVFSSQYTEKYLPWMQEDTTSPAFVAGYSTLSAPSLADMECPDAAAQVLPLALETEYEFPSNEEGPAKDALFCVEVGLGSLPKGTVGAGVGAVDVAGAGAGAGAAGDVGGDGGDLSMMSRPFYYRDGFTASTIYSGLMDPVSELEPDLSSTAHCTLHLNKNGQLRLQMFSAQAATNPSPYEEAPVFECLFEAPTIVPSSLEEDSIVQDSI